MDQIRYVLAYKICLAIWFVVLILWLTREGSMSRPITDFWTPTEISKLVQFVQVETGTEGIRCPIMVVDPKVFHNRYCPDNPKCTVVGAYLTGSKRIEIRGDILSNKHYAESVVVHELTHRATDVAGFVLGTSRDSKERALWEKVAYAVQAKYVEKY